MRIEGAIFGLNKQPIAATVTLIDNESQSNVFREIAAGEKYTLDIDETAPGVNELILIFAAKGYQAKEITVGALLSSATYDITLSKVNTLLLLGIGAGLAYAFSKTRKKSVGKFQTADLTPVIVVGALFFGVNAISKLLDKLGLGGNPAKGELSDPNSAWSPNYWKQFSTFTYAINETQAKQYAATIHNAFTVFQDDFNSIMGVFNQLRTKSNVSFLSDIFTRNYSESLLSFLTDGGGVLPWDGLSKEHLQQLLTYVQNLPAR